MRFVLIGVFNLFFIMAVIFLSAFIIGVVKGLLMKKRK